MKKSQQQPKPKQKLASACKLTPLNALVLAISGKMFYNMNKANKGTAAAVVGCGDLSQITAEQPEGSELSGIFGCIEFIFVQLVHLCRKGKFNMQKKDKMNVDNAKYDSCGVRIIAASDMPVSLWSGGRTTEIYIAPEGALYAERNFLFRISTAEVELEESDFTSLPDYNRLIASVSGTMRLTHGANGSEKLVLPRSTVYAFDGGIQTHCVGKARDLNLMLRKGAAEGELAFVESGTELDLEPAANETMLLFELESGNAALCAGGNARLRCTANGQCALFTVRLVGEAIPDSDNRNG